MSDKLQQILQEIIKIGITQLSKPKAVTPGQSSSSQPSTGGGGGVGGALGLSGETGKTPPAGGGVGGALGLSGGKTPPADSSQVYHADPSVAAVKKMQNTIQKLAKTVISDTNAAFTGTDVKYKPEEDPERVRGKTSFNDFLTEQYLQTSDVKGVEYSPDQMVAEKDWKKQTQTQPWQLNIVMDTLVRIGRGTQPKERLPDGIWDFRTNNALLNIYAFAYSMMKMIGDFSIPTDKYGQSDLSELSKLIPPNEDALDELKKQPTEKKNRALSITQHLIKIIELYEDFREKVISRPSYRRFIEGEAHFMRYDKQARDEAQLTEEEKSHLLNTYLNVQIDELHLADAKGQPIDSISIATLKDLPTFKAYAAKIGYTDNASVVKLLYQIQSQLSDLEKKMKQRVRS